MEIRPSAVLRIRCPVNDEAAQAIDKEYEHCSGVDWATDKDLDIGVPKEHLIFELPDGRALIGIKEWSPTVVCDRLVEVKIVMYLAKKKQKV